MIYKERNEYSLQGKELHQKNVTLLRFSNFYPCPAQKVGQRYMSMNIISGNKVLQEGSPYLTKDQRKFVRL